MKSLRNFFRKKLSSQSITYQAYHYYLKARDYLRYIFSEKNESLIIVLTFDDPPDNTSARIPKFLNSEEIGATFFIPPANTEDKLIGETVSLGHEIGGHGWNHGHEEVEKNHVNSAPRCFNYLEDFYPELVSWRFPGLTVKSEKAYENVKNAGFEIDSTRATYYPISKPREYESLEEYPFLRLPPTGQMDIDTKSYTSMSRFIQERSSAWEGIMVLPFHTWYQNKNFDEFKKLIRQLKEKGIEFKRLIDVSSDF